MPEKPEELFRLFLYQGNLPESTQNLKDLEVINNNGQPMKSSLDRINPTNKLWHGSCVINFYNQDVKYILKEMCITHFLIVFFARTVPNQISRIYVVYLKFSWDDIIIMGEFGELLS